MLPCSQRFAEAAVAVTLVLALLAANADARRTVVAPAKPGVSTTDNLLENKALVEASKARVEQVVTLLKTCAQAAPPGDARTTLEEQLAGIDAQVKDATWTYHVGNYEEAFKKYAAIERGAHSSQLGCDKLRVAMDRSLKSVTSQIDRIHTWAVKVAKIQDPTYRAHCETVYAETEKNLQSLEKTCATTDPAWILKQIPLAIKPLDDALRKSK